MSRSAITLLDRVTQNDVVPQAWPLRDEDLGSAELFPLVLREKLLVRADPSLTLGLACPGGHANPLQLASKGDLARRRLFLLDT